MIPIAIQFESPATKTAGSQKLRLNDRQGEDLDLGYTVPDLVT